MRIGLLAVSLACAVGIAYLAWSWISMPAVTFFPGDGQEVGGYGPLEVIFSQSMQPASVEARLMISPVLNGRFVWQAQTLRFWPEEPLQPGTTYQITLRPGAASLTGRAIFFPITSRMHLRQAQVVYLSHPRDGAEIVRSGIAGKTQLTHTGGKVDGLAVSRDGEQIAFSVKNGRSGVDLWVVDRDGKQARLLLNCGADLCTDPTWSPDGTSIAFSRRNIQLASTTVLGGRIWVLDVASRQITPLYANPDISGTGPSWSPDGRRLAVFDENAGGLRVLDLDTHRDQLLPTSEGQAGCWSNDGQQMLLNDVVATASTSHEAIFLAGFNGQPAKLLKGPVDETTDVNYSVPALSPDGKWIVVGLNFTNGPASSQLWLEKVDGTGVKAITTNHVFTQAAYHWDPASQKLVFQRLELGTSQARPAVVVWDRVADKFTVIDQDAGRPEWLP